MVNNTWTERARLSISDIHCSTTKGTSSGLSRGSWERSTPNTVPFRCSHSSWHTSIHFLCKASPHWGWNRHRTEEINNILHNHSCSAVLFKMPVTVYLSSLANFIPPYIRPHWQQCSYHTACIWPSCSSSSWVCVSVQLLKVHALCLADYRCTL